MQRPAVVCCRPPQRIEPSSILRNARCSVPAGMVGNQTSTTVQCTAGGEVSTLASTSEVFGFNAVQSVKKEKRNAVKRMQNIG